MSLTVLSHHKRRAAHGKHRCGFCGALIAAREEYSDTRCADNGTVWTWRTHLRCEAFASKVVDPYDWDDGIDAVIFADYVAENRELAIEMGVVPVIEWCASPSCAARYASAFTGRPDRHDNPRETRCEHEEHDMELINEGGAYTAFRNALGDVRNLAKTETVSTGKYDYQFTPFDVVLEEVKNAIRSYSLELIQEPTFVGDLFALVNTLLHEDGSMVRFAPMVMPMPKDAQAVGSATTYTRRYSLLAQFGIATGEDDDGRAATVSAQAQPGRRSEEERLIREQITQFTEDEKKAFVADFKTEFGTGLSDLPIGRHRDALAWTRRWFSATLAAPDTEGPDEDAQWVNEAKAGSPS